MPRAVKTPASSSPGSTGAAMSERRWLKISIDSNLPGTCYSTTKDKRGRVRRFAPRCGQWVVFDKAQEPSFFSGPQFQNVLFHGETFEECSEFIAREGVNCVC